MVFKYVLGCGKWWSFFLPAKNITKSLCILDTYQGTSCAYWYFEIKIYLADVCFAVG